MIFEVKKALCGSEAFLIAYIRLCATVPEAGSGNNTGIEYPYSSAVSCLHGASN